MWVKFAEKGIQLPKTILEDHILDEEADDFIDKYGDIFNYDEINKEERR